MAIVLFFEIELKTDEYTMIHTLVSSERTEIAFDLYLNHTFSLFFRLLSMSGQKIGQLLLVILLVQASQMKVSAKTILLS